MEIPTAIINMKPTFSSHCVLIIDDESGVLAVSRAILSSQGFEVACASSGEQAVELLMFGIQQRQRYAACILDLTMPGGLSGFDVLEQLHQIDPDLPVIACSGYFQEDARELCRGIGFFDVLSKPHTPDLLCTTVRRAIAKVADAPLEHNHGETADLPIYDGAHAFETA